MKFKAIKRGVLLREYLSTNFIISLFVVLFCIPKNVYCQNTSHPNIIFILADDMGYGDIKSFNPNGKIATPNLDELSAQGMRFINAHSSDAVCSPSRYGILTGRYCWRSTLQVSVLGGLSKPLIKPGTLTVAQLLKNKGYATGAFGKWHLGLNWAKLKSGEKPSYPTDNLKNIDTNVDYSKPITGGPTSLGFDYFFGISASLDMPPFIYIENNQAVGIPTVIKDFVRTGPAAADFDAVNVVPDVTAKAQLFITQSVKKTKPFFVYLALPSPHTPIVPNKEFIGKSGVTEYGDYVEETDWAVGQIMKTLDSLNISDNTIILFSSDNGFAPYVLPKFNVEKLGHFPSYIFRGYKSDIWEGGYHVPMIVRWPGKVKAGSISSDLISLADFTATCADILHYKLPPNAAVDSYSFLNDLIQDPQASSRPAIVYHSIYGNFAIQQGKWKLELCPGSGGWEYPGNLEAMKAGLPPLQLYDMSTDIKESYNVANQYPEIVKRLTDLLKSYIANGRSTAGPKQKNEVEIDLWKRDKFKNSAPFVKNNGFYMPASN